MSSSLHVMNSHKGDIRVEFSRPGEGTVIRVELPLSEKTPDSELKDSHDESDKSVNADINILWVDDDEQIRSIANDILKILNFEGDVVSSAKEALTFLDAKSYSVVLTDLGMPEMNGWELVSIIRNRYKESIKVAVLTGWGEEIGTAEKERYKIDYVLSKPFKISQINDMIVKINKSR